MKNVAILTEEFIRWGGGKDFIENIIFALKSVSAENDLKLYIFVPTDVNYKQYKGIKRVIFKGIEKYAVKHNITKENDKFLNLTDVDFVNYPEVSLNRALKKFKIDFVFPISRLDRLSIKIPQLIYLPDCQHKYYPNFFDNRHRYHCDKMFKTVVKSGKGVIVNANSVKEDLMKFYGAKAENIYVLPFSPSVKPEFLNDNSQQIEKYNLAKRYFIISNQFWLQKDHETAFRAFAKLLKNDEYKDIELICTGKMEEPRNSEYIDNLKQLIVELDMQDKIRCLGFIPKIKQIEIMKSAIALIQPTLFEGGPGGGSVWDAISLGIPSIVSSISTNKELNEESITFFKEKDADDLCEKMQILLKTPRKSTSKESLMERSDISQKNLGNYLGKIVKNTLNG